MYIARAALCLFASLVAFGIYVGFITDGMPGVLFRKDARNVRHFTPMNIVRVAWSPISDPRMWWTAQSIYSMWDINFWATWAPIALVAAAHPW